MSTRFFSQLSMQPVATAVSSNLHTRITLKRVGNAGAWKALEDLQGYELKPVFFHHQKGEFTESA